MWNCCITIKNNGILVADVTFNYNLSLIFRQICSNDLTYLNVIIFFSIREILFYKVFDTIKCCNECEMHCKIKTL